MLGLLSTPLSARRGIKEDSSTPSPPRFPRRLHNAGSLALRDRQAAAEAEGKTEGPHIARANNCPQCTNKTTALEPRGRPKGQVPRARGAAHGVGLRHKQPGTPRGRGARAQLPGEAEPPEEPTCFHPATASKIAQELG